MKPFSISKVYLNEHDERVIDINPLPEKYCNFDCIFCPLGKTQVKTDESHEFEETGTFLEKLEEALTKNSVDMVFIDPDGELFCQSRISEIVDLIKGHDVKIRIISNGYLFNRIDPQAVLNRCDEVIGEVAVTTEEEFQKMQRPLPGYTLESLVSNMSAFNRQYQGKFILDITILKNYSDSAGDIETFRKFIDQIKPDEIYVHTPEKPHLRSAFGIDETRLREISARLERAIKGNKSG